MSRKKLFITGAAGNVGSALRRYLRDRYDFRLLFHSNVPEVEQGDEVVVSDLSDFASMVEAGAGIDAIVHLGIATGKRGLTRSRHNQMIMETNVQGTYNIFESARRPNLPVRPDSMYGVSKAYGEALGRFYYDAHGMSVYCIRIANFPNTDEANRQYETGMNRWLSSRDMAELTHCCMEAPHPQFGIFYAASKGGELKWDMVNAKEMIGWEPQDRGAPSP